MSRRTFTAPESVTSMNRMTGVIYCQMCNKEMKLVAKRRHTKTCSDACRKALSRRKDTIRREAKKMLTAIRRIRDMHQEWPDLQEFIDRQIRGAIEM